MVIVPIGTKMASLKARNRLSVGCRLKLTQGFRPILTRVMGAQYT